MKKSEINIHTMEMTQIVPMRNDQGKSVCHFYKTQLSLY